MPEIDHKLQLAELCQGVVIVAADDPPRRRAENASPLQLGQNCSDVVRYSHAVASRRVLS
jgi:hypothetical protein